MVGRLKRKGIYGSDQIRSSCSKCPVISKLEGWDAKGIKGMVCVHTCVWRGPPPVTGGEGFLLPQPISSGEENSLP